MSPELYFDDVLSSFNKLASYHSDQLLLVDCTTHLHMPLMALRNRFIPSLAYLIDLGEANEPELTIWYAEDRHLLQKLKAPPLQSFNAQRFNPEICHDDIQIFFRPWQTQLFLYSISNRTEKYWVRKAEDVLWWECAFYFRTIFHFWTRELSEQLVQDNEWTHSKLRKQLGVLKKDPYCAFITCNQRFFLHLGVTLPGNFIEKLMEEHRGLVPSVLLIRKHPLLRINMFDESLEVSSDFDLIRRRRKTNYKEDNVNELLLKKSYHGNNASQNKPILRKEILGLLHRQTRDQ